MTSSIDLASSGLSAKDEALLRRIAEAMIPAAPPLMPSAVDPLIFADILASIGRDLGALKAALAGLDPSLEAAALRDLPHSHPQIARICEGVVARCYYRDSRVLAALGVEERPPFPKGFEVPEGDWSLLDPVRARGPIWRKT